MDNVPRRYAWFRRVLKHHDDEDAALFPPTWEVTRLLVASFAEYTRGDLVNVLGKAKPNVSVLLDALQSTLDFETVFAKRFDMPVSPRFLHLAGMADHLAQFQEVTIGGPSAQASTKWTISSVFDPYFSVYVDAQDRYVELKTMFGKAG